MAAPVVLTFAKTLLVSLYFLTVSPQDDVFSSVWLFFKRHSLPLCRLPSLCWDGLIWFFQIAYLLCLTFPQFSYQTIHYLHFFILAVFRGAILLTNSINFWKKIVACLVYILISLIVWEYKFAQSLLVLIYWIVLKRSTWNLFVATYFFCLTFLIQKIIWWLINPILISPHCVMFFRICDW